MTVDRFFDVLKDSDYLNFIRECRERPVSSGELHHIYPKSFEDGRIDEKWNTVKLSIEDHIKAHILLLLSFEKAGIGNNSMSYQKAANAVDLCCNVQWKMLSESEKQNLLNEVPNFAEIREKAVLAARKRIQDINASRWNGDSMGQCHTPESIQKSLRTRAGKYGNPAGATHCEEVYQKRLPNSIKTHVERYGGMTALMNTPEAREKAKNTMMERYGSLTDQLHTPEAREKTRATRKAKGYVNMTDQMNTPEARKKAEKAIIERYGKAGGQFQTPEAVEHRIGRQRYFREKRRKFMETSEYRSWWEENSVRYPRLNAYKAVGYYLREKGIDLETCS